MDRQAARELLGVAPGASAQNVLATYARMSRRLKRDVTEAKSLEARDRARRALKNLVVLRDLALGSEAGSELRRRQVAVRRVLVDDWWKPEDGVPMAVPDRAHALRWLGFGGDASGPTIRRVLDARARGIKLRIARAATEYDLRLWQQTLADLRRVASMALTTPGGSLPTLDVEETMTDAPPAP